jgi:hypothetical protein
MQKKKKLENKKKGNKKEKMKSKWKKKRKRISEASHEHYCTADDPSFIDSTAHTMSSKFCGSRFSRQ